MWLVCVKDNIVSPQKFQTDEEAERYLLAFLEDDASCTFPKRNKIRCQLNEAYLGRTQIHEGWGVVPYLSVRWIEF